MVLCEDPTMNPKAAYFALAIVGAVIPFLEFVPWVTEHGLDVRLMAAELFRNRSVCGRRPAAEAVISRESVAKAPTLVWRERNYRICNTSRSTPQRLRQISNGPNCTVIEHWYNAFS